MKDYVSILEDEVERLRNCCAKLEAREDKRIQDGPYHILRELASNEKTEGEAFDNVIHQFNFKVIESSVNATSGGYIIERIVLERYKMTVQMNHWVSRPLTFSSPWVQ